MALASTGLAEANNANNSGDMIPVLSVIKSFLLLFYELRGVMRRPHLVELQTGPFGPRRGSLWRCGGYRREIINRRRYFRMSRLASCSGESANHRYTDDASVWAADGQAFFQQ